MYLHFSNSLLLLLLPFRLAVWHSLASIKLVAESSLPLCGSLLLLSSLRMALTDNTMTHTTLTQTLAADVPFPTCTREKSMRSCRQSWERETERDRVELRYMHFDKNKELIAQHNNTVATAAQLFARNEMGIETRNTHTPTNCTATLSCYSWCSLWLHCPLACTCCLLSNRHAHTHTQARGLSLSLPHCGLQFTRWCE